MSVSDVIALRKFITTYFDLEELKTLCFDLGIDYDDLPGEGKTAKVRELIAYCQRHNRVPDLIAAVELERGPISSLLGPPLTIPAQPISAPADPQALRAHFRDLSAGLATLRTDIPGPPFESDRLPEVTERCLQPDPDQGRIILVTEEPGGGKTVFLALLYRRIVDQVPTLAIQPERYAKGSGLVKRVEGLLEQALTLGPVVLLLDSLDVLAASRMDELQDWLRLLDQLKLRPNLTVVVACRTFEARYVPPLSSQQWSQVVTVGLPPTEWVARVFREAVSMDLDSLPAATRELLRVPLHLVLAIEIAEGGGHLDDLTSLHALYGRLLDMRRVDSKERQTLFALAGEALHRRIVDLPRSLVSDEAQLNRLAKTGLIQLAGDVVRLRHQTMRDYLLARRAVEGEQTLREFLDEFGQSLAVHPTLRHLLGLLRRQPKRFAREVQDLLTDPSVRFHIKAGTLGVMASWSDPSPSEAALLVRLFHESDDDRLEMQFFSYAPHPSWFPHLLDSHLRPAAVDRAFGDGPRSRALDYLAQVAPVYPNEVLDAACELLEQGPDRDLSVFFHRLSDALASLDLDSDTQSTFADVLAGAVERGFEWHSFSIVVHCQRLAAMDPGRGLALFFSTLNRQRANGCEGLNEFVWDRSVGAHFDRLLPEVYAQRPYETLLSCADFLEDFFAADYEATERGRAVLDSPAIRLYSEMPHYHADAFFEWFWRQAIAFAQGQPVQAAPLIDKLRTSRWQTLQHLAYLMMLTVPEDYAEALFAKATELLTGPPNVDNRQLLLRILSQAFASFSSSQRDQLTQAILNRPIREPRDERYWVYEPLNHIPEDLRSPAARARVAELSTRFGAYRYTPPMRMGEFHRVPSPIPKEQLAQMAPDALYECLVANNTLEEQWDDETMTTTGGVEQLAAEAAEIIASDLPRYANVLTRLAEDPTNYVYLDYTLGKVELTPALAGWFVDLAQRVYRDERLQLSLARALRSAVGVVTPEQWIDLKPICLHLATAPDPESDRYLEARQQGYHNTALMDGINSTRGAMAEVLVQASQRFWDDDLRAALERLAADPTVSVQAALLYVLPYLLKPAGWDVCFRIFCHAFRPDEPELAPLVPRFLRYAPQEAFEADVYPLLVAMRAAPSGPIAEVAGQLTAFYALRGWLPAEELDAVLFSGEVPIEVRAKVLELVSDWASSPDYVEQCLSLLTRVATDGPDALVNQLHQVFLDLRPADLPRARKFIAALLARPARGEADFWLLEYLEKTLHIWPVKTFEVLEAILAHVEEGEINYRFMRASHSEVPLRIVTFILEAFPDLETRALDTLDRLIALRWRGWREYLRAIEDANRRPPERINTQKKVPTTETEITPWVMDWKAAFVGAAPGASDELATAIANLASRMCRMIGITELERPRRSKDRQFHVATWDVTPVFQDTALPSRIPVFFVQNLRLVSTSETAIRRYLDANSHRIAILVILADQIAEDDDSALEKLRRVYACDLALLRRNDFEAIVADEEPRRALRKLVLSQVDLRSALPFVTTGPTPDNMFFGREKELREITEHAAIASYAVIGGRRVGKTSILGRLHRVRLPAAGFWTFYYQCQRLLGTEPTHQQFLEALAHEWLPDLVDFTPLSFAEILSQLPGDKPLVFLIDEVDRLIPADWAAGWPLFAELRALAESGRCQFVFAGERTLREAMKCGKGPLFNFANAMLIGCLDFPAVEELVTRPMKQLEIELTDEAGIVQRIWDATSGHPNVVQRLCQRLILRLNERQDRCLTPDDVEAIVADPTFQRDDFYDVYLEQATVLERILPLVLARDGNEPYTLSDVCRLLDERLGLIGPTGKKPRAAEVDAALRRLTELRSILDYTPQGYVFAVKAFPQVIARWGQVTVEDELMILTEKYRDYGDLTEDEIEQKEARR